MVDEGRLKFQNDGGSDMIVTDARQFQCAGALEPANSAYIK